MKPKNIAVLITALDSYAQAETLKGIEEYGKDHGYNIAVFLWFAGANENERQCIGEMNIAYLPDLNLFDGVIFFANTLHAECNRQKVLELMESVTCPIVCVGCKVKDAISVYTDNYAAMRKLMEYFVVERQLKRIHFVKGVEGNPDSEARYQAYVDVLGENGIPVEQERVTQGDFYVYGGELAVKEILASDLPFPEAIVCANDIMAVAVCDTLEKEGYRVPEDVLVSGYDYSVEGQNHSPRLTSVRSRFKDIGMAACKALLDDLNGDPAQEDIYLPDEVILNESCGCPAPDNVQELSSNLCGPTEIIQRKVLQKIIEQEKHIMEGDGYEDWKQALKFFISQVNPPEFYCCVNENFVENIFELDVMEQDDLSIERKLAYSSEVDVIIAYKNGMFKNKPSFESRYAFEDMFKESEKRKEYVISPLHYLDRTFGYVVFVDSEFPEGNLLYISWLIRMGDFLETIRKQSLLKNAMSRLDDMYVRDSLTGVYNRFGMERFFSEIKKKCLITRSYMQLSFIDLDGLKRINDEYGHEEGDRIIKAAASTLQKKAGNFKVIRYGGDEFIVLGMVKSEKEVEAYWSSVLEEIDEYNETMKRHAELSLSYGYELFKVETEIYLVDCIRVTDKKMYEYKKQKKMARE